MNFLDIAKNRYTTKKYDSKEKISDELILELKEILRLTPSSLNAQPWKFTFVSDEQIKRSLAASSLHNEERTNQASHLVVFSVIDNIEVFEKQINEELPQGAVSHYNKIIKPNGTATIKNWLQNQVYLSLGFFLSACASLDIDSTSMEGIKNDEYDQILQQKDYRTLFAVAIGYRSSEDINQPVFNPKSRLSLEKVIHSI